MPRGGKQREKTTTITAKVATITVENSTTGEIIIESVSWSGNAAAGAMTLEITDGTSTVLLTPNSPQHGGALMEQDGVFGLMIPCGKGGSPVITVTAAGATWAAGVMVVGYTFETLA